MSKNDILDVLGDVMNNLDNNIYDSLDDQPLQPTLRINLDDQHWRPALMTNLDNLGNVSNLCQIPKT